LKKKLTVRAHAFSAAARKKIEEAGGTCEVLADAPSPAAEEGPS
jgi:ribosomal protein L18E